VEAAVEPATAQAAPGHAQRRVLIIEDNRDTAQSLAQVLEIAGHRVSVAYVGAAGLAQAREFHPEIVLCDIGLPEGMDGYAVARAFRRDASLHSIRLVALTGYALQEDHARALRAGFDEHIGKPPDLGSLLRMIERAPAHLPRRAFPA
jgi:two-component system CheB/CheR fusion protein